MKVLDLIYYAAVIVAVLSALFGVAAAYWAGLADGSQGRYRADRAHLLRRRARGYWTTMIILLIVCGAATYTAFRLA